MPADSSKNPFQIEGARIVDLQSIDVIQAIEERTSRSLTSGSIIAGAVLGFVYASSLGFILSQMRFARIKIGVADRLDKFPAKYPELTAADIARTNRNARTTYIVWVVILSIFVFIGCAGTYLIVR
jgi:hypothetical protein